MQIIIKKVDNKIKLRFKKSNSKSKLKKIGNSAKFSAWKEKNKRRNSIKKRLNVKPTIQREPKPKLILEKSTTSCTQNKDKKKKLNKIIKDTWQKKKKLR